MVRDRFLAAALSPYQELGTSMDAIFRADHIGSFLRPMRLLEAKRSGDPGLRRQIEDEAILQVLAKQKELGFEAATDGEFRRRNFMSDFTLSRDSTWETRWVGTGKRDKQRAHP